jgi:hypothetical protein
MFIVSCSEIGVYPYELSLEGNIDETICQKFLISLDENEIIKIEDRWAEKNEIRKELVLHNLDASLLQLKVDYQKKQLVEKNKEVQVCFTSAKSGRYHGAVIFSSENSVSAIGSWVLLDIKGEKEDKSKNNIPLTGNVIALSNSYKNTNILIYILIAGIILCALLIVYLVLIIKNRKEASI